MNEQTRDEMVVLKNVSKSYYSASGETKIVKNVSMSIRQGEFVGVFGKSGSGKTTLLHMITGIDRATEGEIWIDGTPYHSLNEGELTLARGKDIGIVFQFFQLLPMLTAVENIMLPMELCQTTSSGKRHAYAKELLERVGIPECANFFPDQLSGGQQQRVAIARALANDPQMIVADEPTGNLDSIAAESILAVFKELVSMGKTVVIVTHDKSVEKEFSRVIQIIDGNVVSENEGAK